MRHRKNFNHLGRKKGHRRALLANMSIALIQHKRINTTLAKAKALRTHLEPLITKTKDNTTHNRRVVFSYLQNKEAVAELFDNIGPKVLDRPGGYLRIIKLGFRPGDSAEMAMIEFVDYNETYTSGKDSKEGRKRTRRGRRSSAAKKEVVETTATAAAASQAEVEVAEDVASEEQQHKDVSSIDQPDASVETQEDSTDETKEEPKQ
jgi:large subunit ribosomal protein L17